MKFKYLLIYPYLTFTKLTARADYQTSLATNLIGFALLQATYIQTKYLFLSLNKMCVLRYFQLSIFCTLENFPEDKSSPGIKAETSNLQCVTWQLNHEILTPQNEVILRNEVVQWVNKAKFLGGIVDQHLNWKDHISIS